MDKEINETIEKEKSILNTDEKIESEKATVTGTYSHKFEKPFVYENEKYIVLNFDFNKLTGRDMIAIENEMQALNEYALAPEISSSFQSKMAAKAGGISSSALEAMPLKDFSKITNEARAFLLSSGY